MAMTVRMSPNARVLSARAETDFLYSPQTYFQITRDLHIPEVFVEYLRRNRVDYVVSNAGLVPTEENLHLRVAKMLQLLMVMQPALKGNLLVQRHFDVPTDLAIYQVNQQRLANLP